MLNNYFNNVKIRNFFTSGLFIDLFLKKITKKVLIELIKVAIVSLEKFIVDTSFKTAVNIFLPIKLIQKKFIFNLTVFFLLVLNITGTLYLIILL